MTTPNGRDCPLCDGMGEDEEALPMHLRLRCPAVLAMRERMGLPPEGYGGHTPAGQSDDCWSHARDGPRDEQGRFLPGGATP